MSIKLLRACIVKKQISSLPRVRAAVAPQGLAQELHLPLGALGSELQCLTTPAFESQTCGPDRWLVHMLCSRRQSGSGAERGEPQVGGRVVSWVPAVSWESHVAVVETCCTLHFRWPTCHALKGRGAVRLRGVRRMSGDVVPWVGAASRESRVAVDGT